MSFDQNSYERGRRGGNSRRFRRPQVELLEQRHLLAALTHLDPGGPADLVEQVPVNIVFVGYEPEVVDLGEFSAWLPTFHDPIVVTKGEQVGLHYTYDYNITYADTTYEDAFFGKLNDLAILQFAPANHTYYQELYNQQATNSVEIIQNYLIDAPSVEHWLAANPPAGVDTHENTIFLVNWWGRSDFKFHVYIDNHDPDPGNGFAFGNYEAFTRIAFGGTTQDDEETGLGSLGTHRIWVHDLSAGPDGFLNNWDVDHVDNNHDGIADSWLPPVWEYLARFPDTLAGDLGILTRLVAIDSVMTASPWAPPYLTFPDMPTSINLDINIYEGWKKKDAPEQPIVQPDVVLDEMNTLFRVPMTADVQDLKYAGQAQVAFEGFASGKPHFKQYGNDDSNANLVYQEALNLQSRLDGGGDYEAVGAIYAVNDEQLDALEGISGQAFTNFQDGTQSFVFAYMAPSSFDPFGLPATSTLIHEYGHHFGLNHPHEGYDSEFHFRFNPTIPGFGFVYTGTETNSVMAYNLLNNDFSQFDLDNFNRFWAAGYIHAANAIAAEVLASPHAPAAETQLAAADAEAGLAQDALTQHDYTSAFDHALLAYVRMRDAAAAANVTVVGTQIGRQAPIRPRGNSEHFAPLASPLGRSPAAFSVASAAQPSASALSTPLEDARPTIPDDALRPVNSPIPTAGAARLSDSGSRDGKKDRSTQAGPPRLADFDSALLSLLMDFEPRSGSKRPRDSK